MSNIKLAFSVVQTPTVTNLQSLASSATAGWQSAVIDNSTDLFEDALVQVTLAHSNVAPGSDKCSYVFAYGSVNATYPYPVSGTEGAITVATILSNPMTFRQIGIVPYNVQNATVGSQPMSVAGAFGGVMPTKWGLVVMNYSGAAYQASGNVVEWRGVYRTVV